MKISVIVSTYNRPDALYKVLKALEKQTEHASEVIIADDGSDKSTENTIAEFMDKKLPFNLYHVWHEDLGFRLSAIRNKAIKKSSGEYIILLDGDCVPSENFIKDHDRLAQKGCFFQGKRILVSKNLSSDFNYEHTIDIFKLIKFFLKGDVSNAHHLIRFTSFPAMFTTKLSGIRGCNMAFFRDDVFAVNGFNESFKSWGREDSEFAVRLYKLGLKRKQHPFMAICFHLWHKENDRSNLENNDEILNKVIESNDYFCSNGLV